MSCHDIIAKRILLGQGSFFYPKSPYSFLKYLIISVSIWLDLFILYFLFTFSNSSISSGGNVIFNLFLCFFFSNTKNTSKICYVFNIRYYAYKVNYILIFLHNAQCTPRGGRSTPLGKSPKICNQKLQKNKLNQTN